MQLNEIPGIKGGWFLLVENWVRIKYDFLVIKVSNKRRFLYNFEKNLKNSVGSFCYKRSNLSTVYLHINILLIIL